MFLWNSSGIQSLNALDWLNPHKHIYEYAELLHDNITEEVKQLMLRSFGKESGRVQTNYLTEYLRMDPTHNVGTFLCLLEWFS